MNGNVPSVLSKAMGMEKKPFTYLPGGIDFSELKSPKMQKRINKHMQGGNGQTSDQSANTPFGNGGQKHEPAPMHNIRGSSLPRSMGASTPNYTNKKRDSTPKPVELKKQGSISNLLSWTDPDPQISPVTTSPPKREEITPYNPYAPKKPADDSVMDYNGRQQQANSMTTNNLPMQPRSQLPSMQSQNELDQRRRLEEIEQQKVLEQRQREKTEMIRLQHERLQQEELQRLEQEKLRSEMMAQEQQLPRPPNNSVAPPKPPPQPPTGAPPPPPPPPPPPSDVDPFNMGPAKHKTAKVSSVQQQLQNEQVQKRERERLAELERKRQEEERRRQEEERKRQEEERIRQEEERIRQEILEKQRQEELERQRLAELERQRQAELERQRQAELERQRQEELERQRQAELERQRQEELELKRQEKELEMQMLKQQQDELQFLEELQRQKMEELYRIREEEKQREEQINQLQQTKSAFEAQKMQELEQYMREEMQRQETLTSADLHRQGKPGQMTYTGGQAVDVPDFKNGVGGSDQVHHANINEVRASPRFFIPKDKMEPMEMYEELPSETEMGVSAYEIDRTRFKDKVKPSHPVPAARALPPPSPTKNMKRGRGLMSPKPRTPTETEEKRRNFEEQQRLIEENQKLLEDKQKMLQLQEQERQRKAQQEAEEKKKREVEEAERQRNQTLQEEERIRKEAAEKQRQWQLQEEERLRREAAAEHQRQNQLLEEEKIRKQAEEEWLRQVQLQELENQRQYQKQQDVENQRQFKMQQELENQRQFQMQQELENQRRQKIQQEQDELRRQQEFASRPVRVDLLNRPFFSPPPNLAGLGTNFGAEFFSDPFSPHEIMQPMSIPQVGSTNSTPQPVKEGVSRIIPIKVERGVGAFNQQQNRTPTNAPLTDGSVTINNLDELKSHQAQKNAEESIRGYSKPKQPTNSGSGLFNEMKANAGFAKREQNSSQYSVESVPTPAQQNMNTTTTPSFQPHTLKHVRQNSLPDTLGASMNRRASESDALLKTTRKNVVGELDSLTDAKSQKPSSMFGKRTAPSQSPYMKLLTRALSTSSSNGDADQGFQEGPMSKEYTGEQGRYMPPKHGKPKTNEQYEDVHV